MSVATGTPTKKAPAQREKNGRAPLSREERAAVETARVLEAELTARIAGEVRFDRTSRMLYSTDASNYQIEPIGVVVPKAVEDAQAAVEIASSHGIPILPRGGGSSLAGQTVGAALVIDFSKEMARILDLDVEAKRVTVEPGINIALLNKLLKPNNLMFGPDPASADRATAGGVVGNNSTGSHSILYGMTADQVLGARVALVEGGAFDLKAGSGEAIAALAAEENPRGRLLTALLAFREQHRDLIARDFPPHWRRATGYSLDEFVKPDGDPSHPIGTWFNPAKLLVASEGTLATTLNVTFSLVPTPKMTALVLLQFDELVAAMAATPHILECDPSAVELMDRMLINLTREQPGYASQIAFIQGNPAGILAVEFYGESERDLEQKCAKLEAHLTKKKVALGAPPQRVLDAKRQADVWSVRKAGLGLLMSVRGDAKPIPCIEDVSVPVEHLAEYVGAIEELVADHGTTAAYYAHASAGCLHIRPLVNLKELGGVEAMRDMTHAAAKLAHRFGGVMSGEHGDGLQRSELNELIFGPALYQAMRQFKAIFDPRGLMNPGKKVDAPPLTENLRYGPAYQPLQLRTHLDFSKEGGFLGAVEMCNGAAVCRKLKAGTMCPSYMATRDEMDTTRGRANALRNALAGRTFAPRDFTSKETYDVLDLCLSCKACKTECPSSVDMAKIKTEFLAHYYHAHGTPVRARVFGHIHRLSKIMSPVAPLANVGMRTPLARPILRSLGVHPDRKLSPFVRRTFVHWWRDHTKAEGGRRKAEGERAQHSVLDTRYSVPRRGKVVYFHDTFATYNYPRIGIAAVRLLEAAGFEVIVEERRACCGRPMLSKGLIADARKVARRNVQVLAAHARAGIPIVGTEPSCILTLRDEYLDLLPNDTDVVAIADHAFMLDEFLAKLDADGDLGITWKEEPGPDVLFHGHCHQKALIGMGPSMAILKAAGCSATESGAGCCGMAGSFGYEAEHYEVSQKIGEERLFPTVNAASEQTEIAVAGVSCRQQIEHFTGRKTKHIAELLAEQIQPGHRWVPGTR
ncbi:MAG: FAD-binding and (Fe-S)-binding domain-containing protein [Thermomicrobiales bacterium]